MASAGLLLTARRRLGVELTIEKEKNLKPEPSLKAVFPKLHIRESPWDLESQI